MQSYFTLHKGKGKGTQPLLVYSSRFYYIGPKCFNLPCAFNTTLHNNKASNSFDILAYNVCLKKVLILNSLVKNFQSFISLVQGECVCVFESVSRYFRKQQT